MICFYPLSKKPFSSYRWVERTIDADGCTRFLSWNVCNILFKKRLENRRKKNGWEMSAVCVRDALRAPLLHSAERTCQRAALGEKRPSHPSAAEQLGSLRALRKEVKAKNGFMGCQRATNCEGGWGKKRIFHTPSASLRELAGATAGPRWTSCVNTIFLWMCGGSWAPLRSTWTPGWWKQRSEMQPCAGSSCTVKPSENNLCCAIKVFTSVLLKWAEFWGP